METLARQLYRDHKKALDLLKEHGSGSGFEPAVHRLFGNNPQREKAVRIGNTEFIYSELAKSHVSFLPAQWQTALKKMRDKWRGCENWWAGYPLITWVEIRAGDDGIKGYLKLNAEVGPVSDHSVRKGIIDSIKATASAKGSDRIEFQAGASDKGRLYSRFLRKNSITVNDIRDTDQIVRNFVELIDRFEPEFAFVTSVIPQFLRVEGALSREQRTGDAAETGA